MLAERRPIPVRQEVGIADTAVNRGVVLGREWVIKVTKLCNLRCRYCYEWNTLANPERMSLSLWDRIFRTIRMMNERDEALMGFAGRDQIIWHGGEPTLLPLDYLESVMACQRAAIPEDWLTSGRLTHRMQTNLFSLSDAKLDFFQRHQFGIGISFDVIPGARLDMRGQATEERILRNMARLSGKGINTGLIVVIAGHTARNIDVVYRYLRDRGQLCRVLPLFSGPAERPVDDLVVERDEINNALMRLFVLWFEDGCPFPVRPLNEYLSIVIMKMLGLKRSFSYDRRVIGDVVIVVDVDGHLYEPWAELPASSLGNLATQTMDEILASEDYARSLSYNDEIRSAVCSRCEFFDACGSKEMFMSSDGGAEESRCMTAQPLFRSIERYLNENNIGPDILQGLAMEYLESVGSIQPLMPV
jgi:uncharacterized protein